MKKVLSEKQWKNLKAYIRQEKLKIFEKKDRTKKDERRLVNLISIEDEIIKKHHV